MKDCQPCPSRSDCTRAKRRTITVRRQDHYLALQAARIRETTEAYATEYARRAGVEGTLSQGTRAYGLRRARYIGEAKTALQHLLTAAAINFVRIANWLIIGTGQKLCHYHRFQNWPVRLAGAVVH